MCNVHLYSNLVISEVKHCTDLIAPRTLEQYLVVTHVVISSSIF